MDKRESMPPVRLPTLHSQIHCPNTRAYNSTGHLCKQQSLALDSYVQSLTDNYPYSCLHNT